MDHREIYKIMIKKCNNNRRNKHYLKRYVRFVYACMEINKNLQDDVYTEKHHILSKSKNYWPEYSSFVEFPWNMAILTPRQHYICHWILAKAYGGNMWFAFKMMFVSTDWQERDFTPSVEYELARREANKIIGDINRGRKKSKSSIEKWRKKVKGKKRSKKARDNVRASSHKRFKYKSSIQMWNGKYKINVLKHSDKVYQYIAEGWQTSATHEYRSALSIRNNKMRSTGKMKQCKVYFGQFYCICDRHSEDYYYLLGLGGTTSISEEYQKRLNKEHSEKRKGKSLRRKDKRKRRLVYNEHGNKRYILETENLPAGWTVNSHNRNNKGWFVNIVDRNVHYIPIFEAELLGYEKIIAPNGNRIAFYCDDYSKLLYINTDYWDYNWFPQNCIAV